MICVSPWRSPHSSDPFFPFSLRRTPVLFMKLVLQAATLPTTTSIASLSTRCVNPRVVLYILNFIYCCCWCFNFNSYPSSTLNPHHQQPSARPLNTRLATARWAHRAFGNHSSPSISPYCVASGTLRLFVAPSHIIFQHVRAASDRHIITNFFFNLNSLPPPRRPCSLCFR